MVDNDPDRPTRLLLVCESFTGGCRRHIIDILNAVADAKFETVLAYSDLREPVREENIPDLKNLSTERIRMLRRPAPLADFIAMMKLFLLIRRGRFDIIHLHSSKAGFLGRIAALLARVFRAGSYVIYTPHGLSFHVGGVRGKLYLAAEKFVSRMTDRFAAVSAGEMYSIIKHRLAASEKVTAVPNGVDCTKYDVPIDTSGPPVVGIMGRLTEQKGPAFFIDAARTAAVKHPELQFLVSGDGPLRKRLERRAAKVLDNIEFTDSCDAVDFLKRVGIVVMPSLWEGLPYTLLEAMASGRAIVASDIGGISDTLADCGVLVPPRDTDALAQAVCRLVEDPEERARLGEAARGRVESCFGLEQFSRRIVELYRKIGDGFK